MRKKSAEIIDIADAGLLKTDARSNHTAGLVEMVYRRYWRDVRNYIRARFGIGPPDPEDVTQAAFAKFAALEAPEDIRNQKSFLITIARNIALDLLRKDQTQERLNSHLLEDLKSSEANKNVLSPERVYEAKEELALLHEKLAHMPVKRRELLLMHRLDELSFVEIAARTGLSQSTVKYHVAQGFADCLMALGGLNQRTVRD